MLASLQQLPSQRRNTLAALVVGKMIFGSLHICFNAMIIELPANRSDIHWLRLVFKRLLHVDDHPTPDNLFAIGSCGDLAGAVADAVNAEVCVRCKELISQSPAEPI